MRFSASASRVVADDLEQLVIVGNLTITAGALDLLAEHHIDTVFLSSHGRLRARLAPAGVGNGSLRLAQYRLLQSPARATQLARAVVRAKLANQRSLLQRAARQRDDERLRTGSVAMAAAMARLNRATNVDEVRGFEGAGAAAYFAVFHALVDDARFPFRGRNRRPPLDAVNALLSFGYTLLFTRMVAAVEIVGLDPLLGTLHAPEASRASLALDLMEPFRPVAVDALIVGGIRRGALRPEHFEDVVAGEPVIMRPEGSRALVELFARRMERLFVDVRTGKQRTLRDLLVEEARAVARFILDDVPYEGMRIR